MKELLLRNALDESGRGAREDSLRKVEQKHRIDSLRQITPGVPLVIEEDTLLYIYASLGGDDPAHRVEAVARKVTQIGKSLKLTTDSMHIFESEYTADVMCGEIVLIRVSDLDGLWNGMSRRELAEQQMRILSVEIEKLHADYGLEAKLTGLGWAVFLIVVQVLLFLLTARFIRYLRKLVLEGVNGRLKPLVVKGYELMNVYQEEHILLLLTRILQIFLVVVQLFISLPLLFSIFPETEKFTWNMINYVWSPLRDMVVSIVRYFPNLVKIVVIIYVVRWVLRGFRHLSDEISVGHLKIDSFYQDWAEPTYHIFAAWFRLSRLQGCEYLCCRPVLAGLYHHHRQSDKWYYHYLYASVPGRRLCAHWRTGGRGDREECLYYPFEGYQGQCGYCAQQLDIVHADHQLYRGRARREG